MNVVIYSDVSPIPNIKCSNAEKYLYNTVELCVQTLLLIESSR